MVKKSTCRTNKLPVQVLKCYDVAFQHGERVERVEVSATRIDSDMETLKVWVGDELCGEFRDWLYYVRLDDDDMTEIVENVVLPKDFGKVK